MKVLVDTSVWVAHFKLRSEPLVALLEAGLVVCHPHVVAEVACGTPPHRHLVIEHLSRLDSAPVATQEEILMLIERRRLYGRGCGLIDISLLASTLLGDRIQLWTLDRRLGTLAAEAGCGYQPPSARDAH